jgi:hypothetical protein
MIFLFNNCVMIAGFATQSTWTYISNEVPANEQGEFTFFSLEGSRMRWIEDYFCKY